MLRYITQQLRWWRLHRPAKPAKGSSYLRCLAVHLHFARNPSALE